MGLLLREVQQSLSSANIAIWLETILSSLVWKVCYSSFVEGSLGCLSHSPGKIYPISGLFG